LIYFDTSALMKLVVTEDETAPLEAWLDEHPEIRWTTSDLTRVELLRGVMRRQPVALLQAQQLITRMTRIPVSDAILQYASTCQPPLLRSLDAIHLASAMEFRKEIEWMVVYDKRLLEVAKLNGVSVVSPS
jgi:predicted nucleic acid-binding protein